MASFLLHSPPSLLKPPPSSPSSSSPPLLLLPGANPFHLCQPLILKASAVPAVPGKPSPAGTSAGFLPRL